MCGTKKMTAANPASTPPKINESTPAFIGRMVGVLICLLPAFLGFLIGWMAISLIGIIMFIGFPAAAVLLDTIRWISANYNSPDPDPEYLFKRLKKGVMSLINTLEIIADFKKIEPRELPTQPNAQSDEISKV